MKRVSLLDVLQCEHCGGRVKILAAADQPDVIGKILRCLGLPSRAPRSRHCPRRDYVAASAGMTRDMCVSATRNITLNLLAPPDKSA